MIELHNPWREGLSAVGARSTPKVTKERKRLCLTDANALDLLIAMRPVITNVVGPLIALWSHDTELEHMFAPCQ